MSHTEIAQPSTLKGMLELPDSNLSDRTNEGALKIKAPQGVCRQPRHLDSQFGALCPEAGLAPANPSQSTFQALGCRAFHSVVPG